MKNIFLLALLTLGLISCTKYPFDDILNPSGENEVSQSDTTSTSTVYNGEMGSQLTVYDFIPALQPFVNEGCNTAWDNISAIRLADGTLVYFNNLPDYTPEPDDLDKNRFLFFFQAKNPWYQTQWDNGAEEPYTLIQSAGYLTLPVDDYGSLTCQGLQEIRIWVKDKFTGQWYFNSQVCWAGFLCNGQEDCDQGFTFDQIEFVNYSDTSISYMVDNSISGY